MKTAQVVDALKNDPNNEHEYRRWLGGILFSTYWIVYDSNKRGFGVSQDWKNYIWYSESEFIEDYSMYWWIKDGKIDILGEIVP